MNKILSFGVGVMVLCGGLEAGGAESGLANWLAQYQWTLHGEKAEVVREPENGDFRIRSSASAGAAVLCAVGIGDYPSVEGAARDAGSP